MSRNPARKISAAAFPNRPRANITDAERFTSRPRNVSRLGLMPVAARAATILSSSQRLPSPIPRVSIEPETFEPIRQARHHTTPRPIASSAERAAQLGGEGAEACCRAEARFHTQCAKFRKSICSPAQITGTAQMKKSSLNAVFSTASMRRRYEVWFIRLGLADGSGAWWFRYLLMNLGRAALGGCPNYPGARTDCLSRSGPTGFHAAPNPQAQSEE